MLWLDAHANFNTAQATPSSNIHGMPVACLYGNGPAELKSQTFAGIAQLVEQLICNQ
jgi:arginase family enzyme